MKKMKFIAGIASLMLAATALVPVNASAATMTFTQGDVNGDGKVNVNDLYAISQYLGGEKTADSNWTTRMDADYDKIIDRTDLEMIGKFCTQALTPEKNKSTTVLTASLNEERTYVKYDVATNTVSRYTLNSLGTLTNQKMATYGMERSSIEIPDDNTAVIRVGNGSGFIIGDHLIATAAHCIYDTDNRGNATKGFVVKAEAYDNNGAAHQLTVSSIHITDGYYSYFNNQYYYLNYDYALVYVEEDLSQYGSMQLGMVTNEFIQTGSDISVSGFPGIYGDRRYTTSSVSIDGLQSMEKPYRLKCTADGLGGKSGGPLYYTESNGSKVVIAIFTDGGEGTNIAAGPRISSTLLQFYYNNDNI